MRAYLIARIQKALRGLPEHISEVAPREIPDALLACPHAALAAAFLATYVFALVNATLIKAFGSIALAPPPRILDTESFYRRGNVSFESTSSNCSSDSASNLR